MKRRIMVIWLICALLACPATAMGEAAPGPVVWEQRAYVDEFNMPTDDYYTGHSSPIVGTFSNSATQGSLLYVFFFIDKTVSIRLAEYGNSAVNNPYSSDRTYNVVMMDTEGKKYNFEGQIMSGRDTLDFSSEESHTIIVALSKPGIVRFAITDADQPLTKYIFSVESNTGLPYTSAYIEDGIIRFTQGGAEGLMDCSGNVIVAPGEYDRVSSFSEGLARVGLVEEYYDIWGIQSDGRYGFVDTSGTLVIPLEYDYVYDFSEGLARVLKKDKYGFIDASGILVVPCEYDDAGDFSEGMVRIKIADKWGFAGTHVIPFEYDGAGDFSEGLACVKKDDKWGFIDTSGTLVIPFEYDAAGDFSEGLASVKKDGKWGFIDTSGTLVVPCEYDNISHDDKQIVLFKDGQISFVSH